MKTNERRRYFRINDTMGLAYAPLDAGQAEAFATQLADSAPAAGPVAGFDARIDTLLDELRSESPAITELAELLNHKLNLLTRQLDIDAELMQRVACRLRQVNVSACGLAFRAEETLEPGQLLKLDLLLQPEDRHLPVLAQVISAEEAEEQGCFVRLDFTHIRPNDQELLIQHIVRRQGSQLGVRDADG